MCSISFPRKGSEISTGCDIVQISRIEKMLNEHPQKFREHAFTEEEQSYCDSRTYPAQHYAGRWAIKESFIKGISDDSVVLDEIEVNHGKNMSLSLSGSGYKSLLNYADENGVKIENIEISFAISHSVELDTAMGIVIIQP